MATKSESNVVYAAGLVQGVALVTFPAASTIFTSPSYYDLSNTRYGAMFLPQVVCAIGASIAGLATRYGLKRLYLLGLIGDLAAMRSQEPLPHVLQPAHGKANRTSMLLFAGTAASVSVTENRGTAPPLGSI